MSSLIVHQRFSNIMSTPPRTPVLPIHDQDEDEAAEDEDRRAEEELDQYQNTASLDVSDEEADAGEIDEDKNSTSEVKENGDIVLAGAREEH